MDGQFTIKVKHMTNAPKEITLQPATTIAELKELISAAYEIPAVEQKLVFKGKEIDVLWV